VNIFELVERWVVVDVRDSIVTHNLRLDKSLDMTEGGPT